MKRIADAGNVEIMLTEEKNIMAVTSAWMLKATGVLLVITSLTGCGSTYYADRKINTYDSHRPASSIIGLVYNLGKNTAYSVPKESRQQHEQCVFMVLDNANPGESCTWNDDKASGKVTVARIRPNLCHDIVSTVRYKGKETAWNDTACPNRNGTWKFFEG